MDNRVQLGQVRTGFFRSAHVRVANHLHEGNSGTVHVDQAMGVIVFITNVLELGNILFQVDSFHADRSILAVGGDVQLAVQGQWQIKLRYLVPFHQVRVGVVLAVKFGQFGYFTTQGQAGHDSELNGLFVDDRQGSRQTEAYGTNAGVCGCSLVIGPAGAKHLALGPQLDVYL